MQKFSRAFEFLNWNSNWARFYIYDFMITTKIFVKGIKVKYAKYAYWVYLKGCYWYWWK